MNIEKCGFGDQEIVEHYETYVKVEKWLNEKLPAMLIEPIPYPMISVGLVTHQKKIFESSTAIADLGDKSPAKFVMETVEAAIENLNFGAAPGDVIEVDVYGREPSSDIKIINARIKDI